VVYGRSEGLRQCGGGKVYGGSGWWARRGARAGFAVWRVVPRPDPHPALSRPCAGTCSCRNEHKERPCPHDGSRHRAGTAWWFMAGAGGGHGVEREPVLQSGVLSLGSIHTPRCPGLVPGPVPVAPNTRRGPALMTGPGTRPGRRGGLWRERGAATVRRRGKSAPGGVFAGATGVRFPVWSESLRRQSEETGSVASRPDSNKLIQAGTGASPFSRTRYSTAMPSTMTAIA
jgi:hypothetical protein